MRSFWLSGLAVLLLAPVGRAGEISPLLLHPSERVKKRITVGGELRVSVRFSSPVGPELMARLEAAGAKPVHIDGTLAAVGRVLSVHVRPDRLGALAAVEGVERLEPAVPLVRIAPLDRTAAEIGAPEAWSPPPVLGPGVNGEGVLLSDHEGSWDIFHPDFFRPDAGVVDFEDRDQDGEAGAGDRIDLDGDGEFESTLVLLEGVRNDGYTGEMDFAEPGYQPDVDWLYVDLDGDGRRDFGADEGFGDSDPAFGEPIFVGDDVDGNGRVDLGERLVRLGSSKVRAVYIEANGLPFHVYWRGMDLASYPAWNDGPGHGTGAIGIAAGGWPGLRRYTGVAPGADLLLVHAEDLISGIAFARNVGARVSFHEYDLPTDLQDGSSNLESAISDAASDVVQLAAVGNLAGSDHCMEIAPLEAGTHSVRLSTDGMGMFSYEVAYLNLMWTGDRADADLALTAGEERIEIGQGYFEGSGGGFLLHAWSETTSRGHARVLMELLPESGSSLPETTLALEIQARAGMDSLRGILFDSASGWGKGVSWLDANTDRGSALNPATADEAIGVAAYGGRHDLSSIGWGAIGERRVYSGMGPRIDGEQVVDISAPDDPFTPESDGTQHGRYGAFGGTSGALPHAAGAAVLVADAFDEKQPAGIAQALFDSAGADFFTGAVPNESYGHGKLRPAAAILGQAIPDGEPPGLALSAPQPAVAGRQVRVLAEVTDPDGNASEVLVAWDVGYDRIDDYPLDPARELVIDVQRPGRLPIVARAVDPTGRASRALVVIEVLEDCATAGCETGCCRDDGLCGVCDRDADGDPDSSDCAPDDPDVHHAAAEGPPGEAACRDGVDNDCDGLVDGDDAECEEGGCSCEAAGRPAAFLWLAILGMASCCLRARQRRDRLRDRDAITRRNRWR
ncbi:MAG: S8 family serine peptidase [Deltaproteobacteria bacterium]|nr:S8 family serine peptidase [Deltaproteobacteria bacterium]